jgi:hypothetical protein
VNYKNRICRLICGCKMAALFVLANSLFGWTQDSVPPPAAPDSMAAAVQDLQMQVRELRSVVAEMRSEEAQYRVDTEELRRELQATRSQLAASNSPAAISSSTANSVPSSDTGAASTPRNPTEGRIASLEDSSQLLADKIDEQYQTKIDSASKYRVRLSGIVLLNLFSNRGTTDNQDFPTYAMTPNPYYSGGNLGETLRQSEIGLEVFGPRLAGAKTQGDVQADFAGGFPNTLNGVDSGLFRLRVASVRMDWEHTSIVAGQDDLFLSPQSPTSFASLAVPALSYAGNLWGWIPQVRVEHRIELAERQSLLIQGGILDNLTGEPPYSNSVRTPQAGEASGQPGYGGRIAWTANLFGRPLTVGGAGYYSRQDWGFDRYINGWAGMADWSVPLAPRVSLSGEFYRGAAMGGLGAGFGQSVLWSGSPIDPSAQVRGLDSIGGWAQLKARATSKMEFNGAFGLDNPFAADLRLFPDSQSYVDPTLARNQVALANLIFRPRSNLLFSTEYRHLKTFHISNDTFPASQVNLMMGILF